MPDVPVIKSQDFYSCLIKYGCELISIKGSHHKIRYMANGRVTVIPVHKGREIKKGLFIAILKQLQIDIDAFIVFIK